MGCLLYALIALVAISVAPHVCGFIIAGWLCMKVIRLFFLFCR
jgi:hypothetical protein